MLNAPEFDRSCDDCAAYVYDNDGVTVKIPGTDKPQRRPLNVPTPCSTCPKIPPGEVGRRENAVELSEKNRRAYLHYLECRAVGVFPDDSIVRHNARLIRSVHDGHELNLTRSLISLLGMKK